MKVLVSPKYNNFAFAFNLHNCKYDSEQVEDVYHLNWIVSNKILIETVVIRLISSCVYKQFDRQF